MYFPSEDQGIKGYRSRANELMTSHRVGFSSGSLLSIANVIVNTNVIGFLPRRVYELYQPALKLKEVKTNFELPRTKLFVIYDRTSLNHKIFTEYIDKLPLDS